MRVSLPMITSGLRHSRSGACCLSASPYALPRRSTKSAEIAPSPTRPRMPSVPKYLRLMAGAASSGDLDVVRRARVLRQQRQQVGHPVAQFAAIADLVDGTVLDQELAALETFRQRFADRLLDHTRTGETDQRFRLGHVDVAEHRQRRGNTAGG